MLDGQKYIHEALGGFVGRSFAEDFDSSGWPALVVLIDKIASVIPKGMRLAGLESIDRDGGNAYLLAIREQ
jgi:hypothetical protein